MKQQNCSAKSSALLFAVNISHHPKFQTSSARTSETFIIIIPRASKSSFPKIINQSYIHSFIHTLIIIMPFLLLFLLLQPCLSQTLTTLTSSSSSPPLISLTTTILSPNRTFELGFFSLDSNTSFYLGIWYSSIPIPTFIWVANPLSPILLSPPSAFLTPSGHLAILDSSGSLLWHTNNSLPAAAIQLHDSGNLALLPVGGGTSPAWQSFDFPSHTWLPNMPLTHSTSITSWRSPTDPSPGAFSLRLRPPGFGELELVFNRSVPYWRTGNWTGSRFAGVPEMTVSYIYDFSFSNPFTPEAAFRYSISSSTSSPLSRFAIDPSGQVMQYSWSSQAASWTVFWSRPENPCRVYGRCGPMGFCAAGGSRRCRCLAGLRPANPAGWNSGDFSGGCFNKAICPVDDDEIDFDEIGFIQLDDAVDTMLVGVSRRGCEDSCRRNCSCFGFTYNLESSTCTNLYNSAYNLRNSTSTSTILFIKNNIHGSMGTSKRKQIIKWKMIGVLIAIVIAFVTNVAIAIILLRRYRRRNNRKEEEEYGGLKVFTYKELSTATRGFTEKLGQGGFGVVFRGTLPDSTPVAVKRLERPGGGGGDREFRAEVRTIGNVQHVNLVRLRGFCSEDPQRLLVYDYMPNGPLSAYLSRSSTPPPLTWPTRFQIAIGTARGIAYLHEECRDCIIHCDIKPENILLDQDFAPRVSDFGLAKLVGRDLGSRVLATTRGTRGYVAPEWIAGAAITAKADVYSYGMTLLEIIGGRRNVVAPEEGEEGWFFPAVAARRIVEGELGLVVEEGEGFDVREAERAGRVAVWCIQEEERDRPRMGTVVKMLEGTVEVAPPPLPEMLRAIVAGESFQRWGMGSGGSGGVVDAGEIH